MPILTMPRVFMNDHLERCSAHPGERIILTENKRSMTVSLNDEAFADFVSDAQHYASGYGPDEPSCRGYITSARACLNLLHKRGFLT